MDAFLPRLLLRPLFVGAWLAFPLAAQWTPPSVVDTSTSGLILQRPIIARVSPEGAIGAVWDERTSDGKSPILFERSDDGGVTFQRFVVIDSGIREPTWFYPGTGRALHDLSFGPGGSIWVLWSDLIVPDQGPLEYSFRISRSTDGGASFMQVFAGPRDFGPNGTPRLVVTRDGTVMIICDEGGFTCSRFPGGDFAAREDALIPTASYGPVAWSTAVDDASGTIYVAWEGYHSGSPMSSWVQFCSVSSDTGHSFGPPVRVDTTSSVQVGGQALVAKNDSLLVFYRSIIGLNEDGANLGRVLASMSGDRGSTFSRLAILADSSILHSEVSAALSKSGIAAVWERGVRVAPYRDSSLLEFAHAPSLAAGFGQVEAVMGASYPAAVFAQGGVIVFMTMFQGGSGRNYVTRRDIAGHVEPEGLSTLSGASRLFQNFPNPFNPRTLIRYELPSASMVRLAVYDNLGRELALLASERKEAGIHEVVFDGAGLSSGVYFYRLQVGDFARTGRCVIVK